MSTLVESDIKFIAIAMMIVCFLKSSDAVNDCKLQSTAKDIFYLVGETTKLEWKFDVNLTAHPKALLQLQQPVLGVLYAVAIKTNELFPNKRLEKEPFLNRITWTGNLSDNTASFVFSNVTHNLASPYNLNLLSCSGSGLITNTVTLLVIEPPSKANITCSSGVVTSNGILTVKEGENLNCSCSGTGGVPAPYVYWVFHGKKKNSSKLLKDGILRNEDVAYSCVALNRAGNKTAMLKVDVQYFEFTCGVSLRDDGEVVFKTEAIGNPKVSCGPLNCISETHVTKDTNQTQIANNSVDSGHCNKRVLLGQKFKCGFSSELINYVLVVDKSGENVLLFQTRDLSGSIRLDSNLFPKGNGLFLSNNTRYNPEKDTNVTIRNYFKTLCSGSGILMAPTLISFVFLGFLLVVNE